MPRSPVSTVEAGTRLRPRVKVWFEADGERGFGLGLIAILQAVERVGSIKQAAADLGQSYRHVWGRIKEAERATGEALVEAHVGGQGTQRSRLTPAAQRLMENFLAMPRRMIDVLDQEFAGRFQELEQDTVGLTAKERGSTPPYKNLDAEV
jgi:molybdate transport system regulatory protein